MAITHAQSKKQLDYKWMLGLNIAAYLNWVLATIAGGIFGQWIPDPERFGLDFALPAMFIGLLVLQVLSQKKYFTDIIVAISSGIFVVAASFFVSGSVGVILATILSATIGLVISKWNKLVYYERHYWNCHCHIYT